MNLRPELSRREPKEKLIIALDDLSFEWTASEMEKAVRLYNMGASIREMARKLRPHTNLDKSLDEVAILIMHLARQGKLGERQNNL